MATPPGAEAERDGRYWLEGQSVIDNTGRVWTCTTAGSPGSWTIVPLAAATTDARFASLSGAAADVLVSTKALATTLNTAPADASLAAGECAIWFDKTDGAGKLMIKAKTANGTLATGSVSLA